MKNIVLISLTLAALTNLAIASEGTHGYHPTNAMSLNKDYAFTFTDETSIGDRDYLVKVSKSDAIVQSGPKKRATTTDSTRRLVIPRSSHVYFQNLSGTNVTYSVNGKKVNEKNRNPFDFSGASNSDSIVTVEVDNGGTFTFEIIVAKKLEFIPGLGAGITMSAGPDTSGYALSKNPTTGATEIVKGDSRNIGASIKGNAFLAFDDELGMRNRLLTQILTLGSYSPSHNRLGLVATISADASDPTYQLGVAFFLDREAKCVLTYGVQFRQQDSLLFGLKEGDTFAGSTLPTRKTWGQSFFIGLTFNIATGK